MKSSNGELQCDVGDESHKDTKEEQKLIESLRWNDKQIANRQSWNFIPINTINNFITLKNNYYRVVGPLFERDGQKDGIIW